MQIDRPCDTLLARFNTASPAWRLTTDSDVLLLSGAATDADDTLAIPLKPSQADALRAMTVITSSVTLTLLVDNSDMLLHFVGKRTARQLWSGTVSAWGDTSSVARNLSHNLSFAEQVVTEANSVIVILDRDGNIQRFNRLSEEYTGLQEQDVIGQNVFGLFMSSSEARDAQRNIDTFFKDGNAYEVERWIKTRKGQRLFLFRNKFVHSGNGKNELFLICSGSDITEERRAQERLRALANTDPITGLPNRNAINGLIDEALRVQPAQSVGVIYLDLDNFKKVNDGYGHIFGDQLLQAVSLAILGCLDHGHTLARLGGDEFLILAPDAHQSELEATASRIISRLRQPFRIGPQEVYTGCSLGLAVSPFHGNDRDSLIRNADTAMYTAKGGGRGRFCVFSMDMKQRVFAYLWLDANLRKALEQNHLEVHYQPKVTLDGRVENVEALVRWRSPERGMIPPMDFISCAEESGLIVPLGRWVMLDVVRQVAAWRDKGIHLRAAVNVSARQLADQTIFSDLQQALADFGFNQCPIDIELTESCLIENEAEALAVLEQFSLLGAQIHLDDFGTGYSSLSQLARFPIDAIKLDQSFVRDVEIHPVAQSLVKAIVAVASALHLQVIAEGVETESEDRFLLDNGVAERQGYLFARPMPVVDFEQWLANHNSQLAANATGDS